MTIQLAFLALDAALYPTLLAAVVILLATPQPARLLGAFLAGGMLVSIGMGVAIVRVLDGSRLVTGERSGLSWGADLAIGSLALLLAVMLATRADQRFRERRQQRRAAAGRDKAAADADTEPWSVRILSRGSAPIVFGVGLAANLPGAAYLVALKDIAAGNHAIGGEILLIVAFNLVMFLLAEIPLIGLALAPDRTNAVVARFNAWLTRHGREVAVLLCALLGVFLVVRGAVNA